MMLPCKVIEDMLPMYYDKVCSAESAALVEEHLKDCPHCKKVLSDLCADIDIPEEEIDDIKPLKKIQNSYKKMRLHWLIGIVALLLLIPVAFLVGNIHGEEGNQIIEFPEDDAVALADSFMICLAEGDYANAYTYFDLDDVKHYARLDGIAEDILANLENDGLQRFCEMGGKFEDMGGIESWEYLETRASGFDGSGNKVYYIYYRVKLAERVERLDVTVGADGITHIGLTVARTEHPFSQLCYCNQWVIDNYLGRCFDYNLRDYVYFEK